MWKIMVYLRIHIPSGSQSVDVAYGLDEEDLTFELERWNKQQPKEWYYQRLALHHLMGEPDLDFESEYHRMTYFKRVGF